MARQPDRDGLGFEESPLADRIAGEAAQLAAVVNIRPVGAAPFVWRDPATIPPRPWVVGLHAIRGFCSAIVAPGGVGKTAYAMGLALSVATGRPLLKQRVWRAGPVWIWNLEDGRDELERRLVGAMLHHGIGPADLTHGIYLNSGRDRPLCMAASVLEADGAGGRITTIVHPDEQALTQEAVAHGIGLIVVDPFVSSHALNENSNPEMAAAMTAWTRVADAAQCAVVLVHHTRKGAVGGNIEDARGGSAIANAARIGLTLSRMDEAMAERASISERERWRYVRVDDAKANLAPAGAAEWIRLASVPLGNGTESYPNGDSVQVAEAWTPPDTWDRVSIDDANRVLDRIAEMARIGAHATAHRRGRENTRWAGNILIDDLGLTQAQAAQVIDTWLKNGVLREVRYYDRQQRKERTGLEVNDDNRPSKN